jgi:uncharacterized protein YaiL (DUF2058 family)
MLHQLSELDAPNWLVVLVSKSSTETDVDDPYAAFQISDDLMW